MNAREIQQALEGVAAECLPKHITWEDIYPVIPVFNKGGEWEHAAIHPEMAVQMYCDSMVEWLLNNSVGGVEILRQVHEGGEVRYKVNVSHGWDMKVCVAPTRIEALAKACRQMKEQAR